MNLQMNSNNTDSLATFKYLKSITNHIVSNKTICGPFPHTQTTEESYSIFNSESVK